MKLTMTPEEKTTPFLDLDVGDYFYYKSRFWEKVNYDTASLVHNALEERGGFVEEGESMMVHRVVIEISKGTEC
jgi:hypothetical protein